jgi:hypothetical protein
MKKRLIVTLAGLLALGVMAPAATGYIKNWAELTETNENDSQGIEWTLAEGKVAITDELSLTFDVEKNYKETTTGETTSTFWDNTFGISYDLGTSGDWALSTGLGYDNDTNADGTTKLSEWYPWFEASTALTDNVDLTLVAIMYYNDGSAADTHGDDYELDIVFSTGKLGIFDSASLPIEIYYNTSGGVGTSDDLNVELEPTAITKLYSNDNGVYLNLCYDGDITFGDAGGTTANFTIAPKLGWGTSYSNDISIFASVAYDVIAATYNDTTADDWTTTDGNEFVAVVGAKVTF